MPIDKAAPQHDQRQQLRPGDVPRSPQQLDDRILQQSRLKAREYAGNPDPVGTTWQWGGWKTALGALSVVVLTVSVTIQVVTRSDTADYVSGRAVPANLESAREPGEVPSDRLAEETAASRALDTFQDLAGPEPGPQQSPATVASSDSARETVRQAGQARSLSQREPAASAPDLSASTAGRSGAAGAPVSLEDLLIALNNDAAALPSPGQPADNSPTVDRRTLQDILTIVDRSLGEAGISPAAGQSAESGTELVADLALLSDQATNLTEAYRLAPTSSREQADATFRRLSRDTGAVSLPTELDSTILQLEAWLEDR